MPIPRFLSRRGAQPAVIAVLAAATVVAGGAAPAGAASYPLPVQTTTGKN